MWSLLILEKSNKFSNRCVEARWCSGYPVGFSIRLMGRSKGWWLDARLVSALMCCFLIIEKKLCCTLSFLYPGV